ncbi:hypothetical protein HPP92_008985 [Vanilla planifolia]|uniref:NAC domain-containing protein n=1 Tax=Vanilla planifolia TaxID=51239 RepID=A0A835R954_VANPL|nr:hypothetical protein HPP92_008985 [Vanilla planifolia]
MAFPLKSLPLGFRFRPTDEELVNHYLKGKINGVLFSKVEVIPEIDVCKCEPWDLPDKSLIRSDGNEWFFFAPIDRKYPSGHRNNRATEAGYWKATGKDRVIRSRTAPPPGVIGMKKTLVFHRGRAPNGLRTHWIMHEYRTTELEFESGEQGGYVLYRLFKKSDEEILNCNDDEMGNNACASTLLKSSPVDSQLVMDDLENIRVPLGQTSTEFAMSSDPPSESSDRTIKEQSVGELRFLAEEADCLITSTAKPDCNVRTNFDVVDNDFETGGAMVDPLLNALAQFCDPCDEQTGCHSFPNVASPIPYTDWSAYGISYEPDHLNEILSTMVASQGKFAGNDSIPNINLEFASSTTNLQHEGSFKLSTRDSASSREVENHELALQDVYPRGSFAVSDDESKRAAGMEDHGSPAISIRNEPSKQVENHSMSVMSGPANRRLRLRKYTHVGVPLRKECKSSVVVDSYKVKSAREIGEESLSDIDEGNLEKLTDVSIHDEVGVGEFKAPNLHFKSKISLRTSVLKVADMRGFVKGVIVIAIFAFLYILLSPGRYPTHVELLVLQLNSAPKVVARPISELNGMASSQVSALQSSKTEFNRSKLALAREINGSDTTINEGLIDLE